MVKASVWSIKGPVVGIGACLGTGKSAMEPCEALPGRRAGQDLAGRV